MRIFDPYLNYGWEVSWKKPCRFPQEYFDHLDYFTIKHSQYDLKKMLRLMKARRRYYFEDDELSIKRVPRIKSKGLNGKPDLPKHLFWEYDLSKINWNKSYRSIIERVLARGQDHELVELVRFYGKETVLNVFMNQSLSYWPPGMEENARCYFQLLPEDLLIYHHRAANPQNNIWKKAAHSL